MSFKFLLKEYKVYDGDTITGCTLEYELPFSRREISIKQSVRLFGIDTPELRGRGVKVKEKHHGIASRDFLIFLMGASSKIEIESMSKDKDSFGRILGNVIIHTGDAIIQNIKSPTGGKSMIEVVLKENSEFNANELLLEYGYAVLYEDRKERREFFRGESDE